MKYTYLPKRVEHITDTICSELIYQGAYISYGLFSYASALNWKIMILLLTSVMKKNKIDSSFMFIPLEADLTTYEEYNSPEFIYSMEEIMDTTIYALSQFEWQLVYDEYYYKNNYKEFHINETPLKLFKDSSMSNYMNENVLDCTSDDNYQFYVIKNSRLGTFMQYADRHKVDKKLLRQIKKAVNIIEGLRGYDICDAAIDNDGNYTIAYIIHADEEYKNTTIICNPLVLIYAKELSGLLDEAFERYHLVKNQPEKAGNDDEIC